ncbi:MAG: antibiotic biosynthesis monooxygenase family protein [Flavobacteriales bacterium]
MIVRLVRMAFRPGEGERFLELFEGWRHRIRSFPGCHHLALWRDTADPDVFFTHSRWEGEADLERYRTSDMFAEVWPTVKALFREPAAAWSVHEEVRMP